MEFIKSIFDFKIISEKSSTAHVTYILKDYTMEKFPLDSKEFNTLREISKLKLKHPNISFPIKTIESHYFPDGKNYSVVLSKHHKFYNFEDTVQKGLNIKAIRTLFRQLVEAVIFLHQNYIAHNNIDLSNIYLDEDFTLKLGNFSTSTHLCFSVPGKNVKGPPEFKDSSYNPHLADIFMLGISLFRMVDNGNYPDIPLKIFDKWPAGFRLLFEAMTDNNPLKRITLEEVLKSEWCQSEIYDPKEMKKYMSDQFEENKVQL